MTNHCNTCPSTIRGLCCWISVTDGIRNYAIYPCKHLNKANRCKVYKNRFKINPNCWTIEKALKRGGLPEACAYVQESDIKSELPYKIRRERMEKWYRAVI